MATRLSIIVPFHKGLPFLERVLAGITPLRPGDELLIAADGAVDDCRALAASYRARVVEIPGPQGPAAARNAAAALATRDVLVFVDADVVASTDVVARTAALFDAKPDLAAVFGSYDDDPDAVGFVSQYKNLAHAYVHRASGGEVETFWAGFGAVRRQAFEHVGGFDRRFDRPSIEDIDLGYRLTGAGFRIELDPTLTVCHLKQWTLWSMLKSDVLDRGIPWTQLIHRYGRFGGGLNARPEYRLCVVLAYLTVAFLLLGIVDARFLLLALSCAAMVVYLGRDYYGFFWRRRGAMFALRTLPLHFAYHLYNGVSFGVGTVLFLVNRAFSLRLPGALPSHALQPGGARVPSNGKASPAALSSSR